MFDLIFTCLNCTRKPCSPAVCTNLLSQNYNFISHNYDFTWVFYFIILLSVFVFWQKWASVWLCSWWSYCWPLCDDKIWQLPAKPRVNNILTSWRVILLKLVRAFLWWLWSRTWVAAHQIELSEWLWVQRRSETSERASNKKTLIRASVMLLTSSSIDSDRQSISFSRHTKCGTYSP